MSEQLNVKNISKEEIKQILDACGRKLLNPQGKEDHKEGIKVFNKYFNPQNPLLDINAPLPGQGKWTALAFSTYFGKFEECKALISLGANPSVKLDNGLNVLHIAATEGKPLLCVHLLKNGVNVDSLSNSKQTAMMRACEAGHLDVVQSILPFNPNLMLEDNDALTCLDYGFKNQHYNIVKYIQYYVLEQKVPLKNVGEYVPKKTAKI